MHRLSNFAFNYSARHDYLRISSHIEGIISIIPLIKNIAATKRTIVFPIKK